MNTFLIAMLNGWEIIMILVVVLVLFGAKKLPELAKGLGQGIKEFKKASREVTDEFHRSMEEEQAAAARKSAAPPAPAPAATTAQTPVADTASTPKAS